MIFFFSKETPKAIKRNKKFTSHLDILVNYAIKLSNSNWTEWSTIQGVIARVISKSDERDADFKIKVEILELKMSFGRFF